MSYTAYTASYIVNSNSAQGTTDFTFTFPYIKEEHIEVFLNYSKLTQGSGSAQYQVITNVSPKLIRLNTGIASANLRVEVRRNSSLGTPLVDYADGSTLTANDLDTSALQSLYIDQELKDNQGKTVSVDEATGLPTLNNLRLTNVADPTAAQDAATKNYIDTKVFTSAQIQDGTITSADIANGTIVNADINASAAIEGSKLQASTSSNAGSMSAADKSKLDGIDTGAKDDQTAAEIRTLVEDATDSNVFTDADHTKLNAAATLTGSETLTNKTLTSPVINDMSGTAVVTSGTSTSDNKTYSAKRAGEIFYGKDTLSEIQSGETWSAADDKIATTSAIDARIIDLVDDVGGFVPIANETSFPTANPDVNNGAGTLVSIKAFASSHTPSGGSVTIANGAGSGNTVTITGCGSTVLAAGFGGIVETTSTLHTYTFHRLSPKATEVTTVAGNTTNINTVSGSISNVNAVAGNATNINAVAGNATNINAAVNNATNINAAVSNASNINSAVSNASNITTVAGANSNITTVAGSISNVNTVASNITDVNSFADLYQIATSAPSTDGGGNSLAVGDLWFDSSSNKTLKVHNGTSFQAVSPTQSVLQDISIVSGQLTFTEDLGSIADSLTTGTGNNINTVASGISNVNTVAGISSNVTTVAGIASNVTSVAGAVSNINTTVSNLASINNFAEVYRIASSAPSSSLNEGDLWYDSTANVLKYYNGTVWTVTAAAGLSNVVEDTTPELGGHLDCNDKNLTEVGTISGNNLQVDFGTLS